MADYPLISDTPTDHFTASEFGGVDGLIQPPPHVPDASEKLMQNYQVTQHPVASE
jgi:hypothetical protein